MSIKIDATSKGQCEACNGCINCSDTFCIFHNHGNPENCYRDRCLHCRDYIQRDKLFLNNVG